MTLRHMVVDVFAGSIEPKEIDIEQGRIVALRPATGEVGAGV